MENTIPDSLTNEELLARANSFLIWSLADGDTHGYGTHAYDITVEKRSADKWAVMQGNTCFSKQDQWFVYEPLPSNREADFLADTRFEFKEAVKIALKLAKVYEQARINTIGNPPRFVPEVNRLFDLAEKIK